MKTRTFLKQNKILMLLLIVEAVIVTVLITGSFGKRDVIHIEPGTSAESGEERIIYTQELAVRPTAYDVTVKYSSVSDPSNPDNKSYGDVTGDVSFSLPHRQGIWSNPLYLSDGTETSKTRIWVNTWASPDGFQMNIHYYGKGQLTVQDITLRECMLYRVTRLIGFLTLAVLIDLAYMFLCGRYFKKMTDKGRMTVLALTVTILFSSFAAMGTGVYSGDDLLFHLHRIVSLSDALKSGNIPQRIQLNLIHGYGYASPQFYGEIFLLIPALLYLFCVPLQVCYQIYVILVNIATCLITYWCAKKMTDRVEISVTGAFLYTCSAYRLTNVYMRCAVGEYTAMAFLPLVIYGFYHLYEKSDRDIYRLNDYFPLAIGLTGVIETHTLSVAMLAILIGIFILFHLRKTFRIRRFWALVKTVVLTFLLNAWFLIPMLSSLRQDLKVSHQQRHIGGNGSIELGRLFSFLPVGTQRHLTLGLTPLLGILLFVVIKQRRGKWQIDGKDMQVLDAVEGLGILSVFFVLPCCQWDNIYNISNRIGSLFAMVQFAWRYLAFASVMLVFGIVLSLRIIGKNVYTTVYYGIIGMLVLCTAAYTANFTSGLVMSMKESDAAGLHRYYMDNTETDPNSALTPIGVGDYVMVGEYLPSGMEFETLNRTNVTADENIEISGYRTEGNTRKMTVSNTGGQDADISIPLVYYENYHAYLDDGTETAVSEGEDERVQINVPANYSGTITVRYVEPVTWRAAEVITLIAWADGIYMSIRQSRKRKRSTRQQEIESDR